MHFKKARGFFGNETGPVQARWITDADGKVRWESSAVVANVYDKVVGLLNEGRRPHEIADTLQLHKSNIGRYAQRAKEEGKLRSYAT